jgi:hypothetical protein
MVDARAAVARAGTAVGLVRRSSVQATSEGGRKDPRHLTRLKHLVFADKAEGPLWASFCLSG